MPPPEKGALWTDDYTNLFRVLRDKKRLIVGW